MTRPSRIVLLLSWAALTYALAQTTVIAAFSTLQRVFDADAGQVAWTISGFLVMAAVATPIFGRLGDMFGKRRMLVVSLAVFGAGSIVSALAESLGVVVAGRALQGLGGGIFPLCFAIVRDEVPPAHRRTGIGAVSATVGIGGGLGLLVGGLLVDHASWQAIFWFNAAFAGVSAVAAATLIPESPVRSPARVDYAGGLVLGLGLALPLVAITQAVRWGWGDARTLGLAGAGAVVIVAWARLERRTAAPMADMALLARPPVLMTNLATFLTSFGLFGTYIAIPQLAQAPASSGPGFGLSGTGLGLLLLPGAVTMLLAGPASGALGNRAGNRMPLVLGALAGACGLFLLALEHGSLGAVIVFTLPLFAGMGLAFAAMPNLIVDAVAVRQTGEATGLNALVRVVGSALGGQLCATLLVADLDAAHLTSDASFTRAFLFGAVMTLVGALAASLIPRVTHDHAHNARPAEQLGVATPLPEPANVPGPR